PPHPARPTQPPTDQSVEPNSYRIWGLLRLLALPS
ncbi:sugar transferase, partial [Mycobacterium tuberculosis]|nr:sugar transferase [Mycobacterium tuberculosis]MCE4188250.1 sugar transferase [Mycobacterium tuberculosis]MCE4197416.1 sugar transferase [Mycobacterium tuberculosis]MCE4215691.1 sugar transferase [Mycobacterium tuberculosis]MCE4221985.1 sugar transferase [Mycobacterium tuberculosis]